LTAVQGSHTRFERTPETAQRDAEIASLRGTGMTYQQIADRLGVSKQSAHEGFRRALRDAVRQPTQEAIGLELDRLDVLWRTAITIMASKHIVSQNGRVVRGDDGQPIEDPGPRLAAIDRALRIMERRARLIGLDAPVRVDARISDSLDAEIERLAAELHFIEGFAGRGDGDTDDPDPT
jgi:hypothetical protein